MAVATVFARAVLGVDAPEVRIETYLAGGTPAFSVVGLPETAVKEARDRVRGAIVNSGFEFPQGKVVVSLAPAELPKEGSRYDLPIALALLGAQGHLPRDALKGLECIGELSLDGQVRAISGVLVSARAAHRAGRRLVVPSGNRGEARAVVPAVWPVANLHQACAAVRGETPPDTGAPPAFPGAPTGLELSDVRGQAAAKRALAIAAAGSHHLLMTGPPGTGKSMLARRLPGLLPPLTPEEAVEAASVHSVAGADPLPVLAGARPFREPHHTASAAAMIGGGRPVKAGELALAHHGVLFMDELPEFDRRVLEALRQPLESGELHVARVNVRVRYPARFQLVAAMNPCPVGHECSPATCRCSAEQARRYQARISGPLLDRMDLRVRVPKVPPAVLGGPPPVAEANDVPARVAEARRCALERAGKINAALAAAELEAACGLGAAERRLLEAAAQRLALSARGYHRTLRVARTIADLAGEQRVAAAHVAEALSYRDTG